ncbi:MAG TPA: hypothetical protein VLF94_04960 [Chlamydiales bacterium]|nr:hypothetical protein [Chlamydiales bacterium]
MGSFLAGTRNVCPVPKADSVRFFEAKNIGPHFEPHTEAKQLHPKNDAFSGTPESFLKSQKIKNPAEGRGIF